MRCPRVELNLIEFVHNADKSLSMTLHLDGAVTQINPSGGGVILSHHKFMWKTNNNGSYTIIMGTVYDYIEVTVKEDGGPDVVHKFMWGGNGAKGNVQYIEV